MFNLIHLETCLEIARTAEHAVKIANRGVGWEDLRLKQLTESICVTF